MSESRGARESRVGFGIAEALLDGFRIAWSMSAATLNTEHVLMSLLRRGLASYRGVGPARLDEMRRMLEREKQLYSTPQRDLAEHVAGDSDVYCALREARWRALGSVHPSRRSTVTTNWHSSISAVLCRALNEARVVNVEYAGPVHLLEAIIAGPNGNTAVY